MASPQKWMVFEKKKTGMIQGVVNDWNDLQGNEVCMTHCSFRILLAQLTITINNENIMPRCNDSRNKNFIAVRKKPDKAIKFYRLNIL
jgi:hypothetical protein